MNKIKQLWRRIFWEKGVHEYSARVSFNILMENETWRMFIRFVREHQDELKRAYIAGGFAGLDLKMISMLQAKRRVLETIKELDIVINEEE